MTPSTIKFADIVRVSEQFWAWVRSLPDGRPSEQREGTVRYQPRRGHVVSRIAELRTVPERLSSRALAGASFIIALFLQYSLSIFSWVFPDDDPVPVKRAAVLFSPGIVFIPAIAAESGDAARDAEG